MLLSSNGNKDKIAIYKIKQSKSKKSFTCVFLLLQVLDYLVSLQCNRYILQGETYSNS